MNKVSCNNPNENCVESNTSCHVWNGGKIDYLGINNGDELNKLMWEIITKLKSIAGQDLTQFDLDSLLEICGQNAPSQVTLISILNLVKNNQVCLKQYVDDLAEVINELPDNSQVNIDLKGFKTLDNLGNIASVTRDELDQLVINRICNHEDRIKINEQKVTALKTQIDNIDINPQVQEPKFNTCIDSVTKATSEQTKSIADALCDLRGAVGSVDDISAALGNTPEDFDTEFGTLPNWIPANSRNSWADAYGNLLLVVGDLRNRIKYMEENCCAVTCDDVQLGFGIRLNEDGDGLILQFTSGSGTSIPAGFTDKGSTIKITDSAGNFNSGDIEITNNAEIEIIFSGLGVTEGLTVEVTAVLGNGSLTCQKCLTKFISGDKLCDYCDTQNVSPSGEVTVIYHDPVEVSTTTTTTFVHPGS